MHKQIKQMHTCYLYSFVSRVSMTLGLPKTRNILAFQYFVTSSCLNLKWGNSNLSFFCWPGAQANRADSCPACNISWFHSPYLYPLPILLSFTCHHPLKKKNKYHTAANTQFTTQTVSSHHSHTLRSLRLAMNAAIQRQCEQKAIHNGGCHLSQDVHLKSSDLLYISVTRRH